jgi:hypothetical protein
MDTATTTKLDTFVARGAVIGTVGDRAAHGTPHLHFTAFSGEGLAAYPRSSIPLSFAEGYELPAIGGCSQHAGETLVAGGQFSAATGGVRFGGSEPGRWYNADIRIQFDGVAAGGFSQAWDHDPGGDIPQFARASAGYMQIAWAGEGLHTLYLRIWDASGQQTLTTYGPVGYDLTPPQAPAGETEGGVPAELTANMPGLLSWDAATDNGSGVAGYRVYIGIDPSGTSDWFTPTPQVTAPALAPGSYLLRVQPLDYAGNAGEWTTIGQVTVRG